MKTADWTQVIADCESLLRQYDRKRASLRASIRHFKRRMAEGEPLPDGLADAKFADRDTRNYAKLAQHDRTPGAA